MADGTSRSADAMREAVSKSLALLRRSLANAPDQVTAEDLELWTRLLLAERFTPAEVEAATLRVLRTEHFWTTFARFLAVARPAADGALLEEAAWQRVRTAVQRIGWGASLAAADLGAGEAGRRALWAVERVGWERICEAGERERKWVREEFVRLFRVATLEGAGLDYLPGRFEEENRLTQATLSGAMCGRPDWKSPPGQPLPAEPELAPLPAGGLAEIRRALALPEGDAEGGQAKGSAEAAESAHGG